MRVAICSSEATPFVKTGGLADVVGALPLALEKIGVEVSLFLPFYRQIKNSNIKIEEINSRISKTIIGKKINVYFVKNDNFFDREGVYGDLKGDYKDNLDRFQFFCIEILEFLEESNCKVDILHCHDWHTALIPVYLKELYGQDLFFQNMKSIFTIHNLAYQGVFDHKEYKKLGFPRNLFHVEAIEFYNKINLMKAGIIYADNLTTVSPQYAKEIRTKTFGCGLEGVIKNKKNTIDGILNGLDYQLWNPETDKYIVKKYLPTDYVQGKKINKEYLQKTNDLDVLADVPLVGFVGRISHQKGIDLILDSIDDFMKLDVQLIIQGVGEMKYKKEFLKLVKRYRGRLAFIDEFDEKLAHQIYAGSDLFLMPSEFEPCGLGQMIALAFGTIPIVFKTGGLVDTITSYGTKESNGFVFTKKDPASFLKVLKEAKKVYGDKEEFNVLINNAFKSNFSWDISANNYKEIYQCLLSD